MSMTDFIRTIPDFPKPGIMFRDITPLLAAPKELREAIDAMAEPFSDTEIDIIVSPEARGFIFGVPLAQKLNAAFVPVRKPGKLPGETVSYSYDLEYGSDTIEVHADAIPEGARVLVVDDLLATGGTIAACIKLVEQLGGKVVGCSFLIELIGLPGREIIKDYNVHTVMDFEEE